MRSDATAVVIGHLGGDPRTNTTPTGKTVVTLSVAVNRRKGEEKLALWVKGEVWNPHPDLLAQLKKGAYVRLRGDMYPDDYTNKQGAVVKGFKLASANVIILAESNEGGSRAIDPDEVAASAAAAPSSGGEDIDDLPF